MKKKILASILAAVTMAMCAFSTVACSEEKVPEEQVNAGLEQTYVGGGMQIGEGKGSGIQLMRTTLLSSEYENYGISPLAETAYERKLRYFR